MKHINSLNLKTLIKSGANLKIIDVRSPAEFKIYNIPNSINVPMLQLVEEYNELLAALLDDYTEDIIIYCNMGIKSVQTIALIEQKSDKYSLINLEGGLSEWNSKEED
ncbi:rhodanese-like domain-containing protein [Rickettsiales bacterium LUAb2]